MDTSRKYIRTVKTELNLLVVYFVIICFHLFCILFPYEEKQYKMNITKDEIFKSP